MAELPRGVRGHTYTVMITIFFLGGGSWAFWGGASTSKYPRCNSIYMLSKNRFSFPISPNFLLKIKAINYRGKTYFHCIENGLFFNLV